MTDKCTYSYCFETLQNTVWAEKHTSSTMQGLRQATLYCTVLSLLKNLNCKLFELYQIQINTALKLCCVH